MIYVSSSCLKKNTIKESVQELAKNGYKNIELSGGTNFYKEKEYIEDLLELKKKYNLNYQVHNYFPPPKEAFMLNIASLNDELFEKSVEHCLKAINLCKILGSKKYSVHAGFLIDFTPRESGKKILLRKTNHRASAIERLSLAWEKIIKAGNNEVDIYIENNVYSKNNYDTYKGNNPFLLTDYNSYIELFEKFNFKVLLDLAHLKVSCNTLNLDFFSQSDKFFQHTDYLHISGNNGLSDQNFGIINDDSITNFFANKDLTDKTLTLEIYSGLDEIRDSYQKIESFQKKKIFEYE